MRRTSSGSDIANSALFQQQAETPYVYMAAASPRDVTRPLNNASDSKDGGFRRHCVGATIRHAGAAMAFPLPSGFNVEIDNTHLTATAGLGGELIFSLPLVSIVQATVLRARGQDVPWTHIVFGCCFGDKDVQLALDVDAPAGWLQEGLGLGASAGPIRLSLFVRDVDEWIEAMGIELLIARAPSPAKS